MPMADECQAATNVRKLSNAAVGRDSKTFSTHKEATLPTPCGRTPEQCFQPFTNTSTYYSPDDFSCKYWFFIRLQVIWTSDTMPRPFSDALHPTPRTAPIHNFEGPWPDDHPQYMSR